MIRLESRRERNQNRKVTDDDTFTGTAGTLMETDTAITPARRATRLCGNENMRLPAATRLFRRDRHLHGQILNGFGLELVQTAKVAPYRHGNSRVAKVADGEVVMAWPKRTFKFVILTWIRMFVLPGYDV
jgi:hypothetical protein